MRTTAKTIRIAFLLVAALAAGALAPAAASAADTEITSSKVTIGLQSRGWTYYCPASYPYLKLHKGGVNASTPIYRNLSSSGVSAVYNPLQTKWYEGRLTITFTNWNLIGTATQQIAYTCTTDWALD